MRFKKVMTMAVALVAMSSLFAQDAFPLAKVRYRPFSYWRFRAYGNTQCKMPTMIWPFYQWVVHCHGWRYSHTDALKDCPLVWCDQTTPPAGTWGWAASQARIYKSGHKVKWNLMAQQAGVGAARSSSKMPMCSFPTDTTTQGAFDADLTIDSVSNIAIIHLTSGSLTAIDDSSFCILHFAACLDSTDSGPTPSNTFWHCEVVNKEQRTFVGLDSTGFELCGRSVSVPPEGTDLVIPLGGSTTNENLAFEFWVDVGYGPPVVTPIVPTLSEWGAIIFGSLLFASVVFYIWRRRRAVTA